MRHTLALLTMLMLAAGSAYAGDERNLDARTDFNAGFRARRASVTSTFGTERSDLALTHDSSTGVVRTLSARTSYLTDAVTTAEAMHATRGEPALAIALGFVTRHVAGLGLEADDIADHEVTDQVYSQASGATHVYLRQRIAGLPVYNGQLQVNVNREGRILSVNNAFMPDAARAINTTVPTVTLERAVAHALRNAGMAPGANGGDGGQLMWLPIRQGMLRLVWRFQVRTPDGAHWYDFTVDAVSGRVWTRFDWVAADSYKVYPPPVESPSHSTPATPSDGRSLVTDPAHATASPFGWHDTDGIAGAEFNVTRGNNAWAYKDGNADNLPDAGTSPDGTATRTFDFPLNLTLAPTSYVPAAVTSAFYWNNIVHDVQYQYGFDEAAGNFQENVYGRGGIGGDAVLAEAQDGGGTNNANFATPPDGQAPRMQMYEWTSTSPRRDSDLDSGVIVHEYGHGISNRLVGGPSNVSCMANSQQPGEGISDWLALVYTARASDTAAMGRGFGTYLLGQPTTGLGVRQQRYSTDPAVNTWTYASINTASVPHALGAVFGQALWEVYWRLVADHGWSADLYDAGGSAGNQRALLYLTEGLKNTICSPTFTDVRDGFIQATVDLHGGADTCAVWQAFATFGLGSDAVSGGANGKAAVNGFNRPVACGGTPAAQMAIADALAAEGGSASFTVTLDAAQASQVTVRYATGNGSSEAGAYTSANSTPITIQDNAAATPYPSTIVVPAIGAIRRMTVTVSGLTHNVPHDLQALLVAPTGEKVKLFGYAGTSRPVSGVTVVIDDAALNAAPPDALLSGTFRPADYSGGVSLPAPAPAAPYGGTLSVFSAANPAGTWSLYVSDHFPTNTGSVSGGWSITFATDQGDYDTAVGTLSFGPGVTSQVLDVAVNDDAIIEGDETFTVALSGEAGNVDLEDATGVATIQDDDLPALAIADSTVEETNAAGIATFTVTLSAPSPAGVTVDWATGLIGGATSGVDYTAASGSLTFAAGQTSRTIEVTVAGDTVDEGPELFYIGLSMPDGATIADGQASGKISDDDPPPVVSFTNDPVNTEGDAGTTPAAFTVTLTGATERTVDVDFATGLAGTAASGTDYATSAGRLRYTPGQTSKAFRVYLTGDAADEPRETYFVNLASPLNATIGDGQAMGTIVDNDPTPAGSPVLSLGDAVPVVEGDSGAVSAVFTVSLSAPAPSPVTFTYGTGAGGSATSGVDYVAFVLKTATIAAGQSTRTVTVVVNGDAVDEAASETFFVNVTSASNAAIGDGQGQGTIADDDP